MAIIGIQSILYGVDDVQESARFFRDFGLLPLRESDTAADFAVGDGSSVLIRKTDDPAIPAGELTGQGVREIVWGVDTPEELEKLAESVAAHVAASRHDGGTVRFTTPCGLPMGLRVFDRKPVVSAPDVVNAPGRINRLNSPRRWRKRARPKSIGHVVFAVQDFWESFKFLEDALNFRLSDYQRGYGVYARADGSSAHHNIFLLNAELELPGMDGKTRFHHTNFSVDDIDEIMAGANYMTRQGWEKSHLGLGRHRIDSALFYYLPFPGGGEAEYGADGDAIDDDWVPREWTVPLFGYMTFVHEIPPFFMEEPKWEFNYMEDSRARPSAG